MLRATDLASAEQAFLNWLAIQNYSPDTIRKRREHLDRFVGWAAEQRVTEVIQATPQTLEDYQRVLFEHRKRNGQPLSTGVRRNRMTSLRVWFRWLLKQGWLLLDPAADVQLPRDERRLPRQVFTAAEVERVLAMAAVDRPLGLRNRTIMELLYSTGIRRKEVIALCLTDIDRTRRTLLIRQGKGRRDRVVPFGRRALDWIERYLKETRPQLMTDAAETRLFLTRQGRPLRPNCLTVQITGYVRQSGVGKQGSCHLFRHAAATLMLDGGADVRYVQALLGHLHLNTTQLYTHVSIGKLREVHDRTHPASKHEPDAES